MKIAIDFDGTCVKHCYPIVGPDCPGAVDSLKWLLRQGHELNLFTMRGGIFLEEALDWFSEKGIELAGVQADKDQASWTTSPKCYAEIYLDDAALGAPLIREDGHRPYFDWAKAREMLLEIFDRGER
jgi:hypothetical protein